MVDARSLFFFGLESGVVRAEQLRDAGVVRAEQLPLLTPECHCRYAINFNIVQFTEERFRIVM